MARAYVVCLNSVCNDYMYGKISTVRVGPLSSDKRAGASAGAPSSVDFVSHTDVYGNWIRCDHCGLWSCVHVTPRTSNLPYLPPLSEIPGSVCLTDFGSLPPPIPFPFDCDSIPHFDPAISPQMGEIVPTRGTERHETFGGIARKQNLAYTENLCEQHALSNHSAAIARIRGVILPGEDANALLQRMIDILQNARITVNFFLGGFIQALKTTGGRMELINAFLRNQINSTDTISRRSDYFSFRNASENALFGIDPSTQNIRQYGTREFIWSSRPLYGTLDILSGSHGGAPKYGHSFMILKKYVNHVSTFYPTDSIDTGELKPSGLPMLPHSHRLSTYWHFENLVAHAQEGLGYSCFRNLLNLARGYSVSAPEVYGSGSVYYIESQTHAQVFFERDVNAVCYSRLELTNLSAEDRRSFAEYLLVLRNRCGIDLIEVP